MLRGHCSGSNEVMLNLQTISAIVLDRQTISLIKKGRFPNLKKLGLQVSSRCKDQVPELLQSLHQLCHLKNLRIYLEGKGASGTPNHESMEWNIGCKPQELLQSLGQLSCLTILRIMNVFDLLTCGVVTFPPNVTKLTLAGIKCITDEGMKALGNLTKLGILKLLGSSDDSFDLNCVEGGFPQLQVLEMSFLGVGNWKLGNGTMLRLQSLEINYCEGLNDLPNELWSLTDLREVRVRRPSEPMAHMLRNLKIKNAVELVIGDIRT